MEPGSAWLVLGQTIGRRNCDVLLPFCINLAGFLLIWGSANSSTSMPYTPARKQIRYPSYARAIAPNVSEHTPLVNPKEQTVWTNFLRPFPIRSSVDFTPPTLAPPLLLNPIQLNHIATSSTLLLALQHTGPGKTSESAQSWLWTVSLTQWNGNSLLDLYAWYVTSPLSLIRQVTRTLLEYPLE